MNSKKVIVVGGGPAGIMAAIRARQLGADVTLIEKNPTLGQKLCLTGKGRCNMTNACDLDEFLRRFSNKNGSFLRDAFKVFFNKDLFSFFEERGLNVKIERQQRAFPVTDESASVLDVLKKELIRLKIKIFYQCSVKSILIEADNHVVGVVCNDGQKFSADHIILATGGLSYAFTGSTGEGLKMAGQLGHHIVEPRPGLVPLKTKQSFTKTLSDLTLKNIRLKFTTGKTEILSAIGELSFTDFGISGALVLSLSGKIVDWIAEQKKVYVEIDLKPALSSKQLHDRFVREFQTWPKINITKILEGFLPLRLIEVFLDLAAIAPERLAHQITQKQRESLVALLKGLKLDITGSLPIEEAMVTRGGVSLKEINPRTMESRRVKGLYFAGEMIDIDGDTGGFNLQAAFSTGYLAGQSATQSETITS